jgi:arylsulfatase A-like enzyme
MQATKQSMAKFPDIQDIHRRIFAAMLSHLDECVGKITAKLDDMKLTEETLVVFLSDNGGPTRELTSSNRPLRGEKGQLLEGGIRVPFIVSWPAVLPQGKADQRPVSSLDVAATMQGANSITASPPLDGSSWLYYWNDSKKPTSVEPRTHYWRVGRQAALREGSWKLYRSRERDSAWELYDLQKDVSESNDLAKSQPDEMARLVRIWEQMNSQMVDPLW